MMRIFVGLACVLAACQPVADGNETQGNQPTFSAGTAQTIDVSGDDDSETQAARNASEIMGDAEMYAEGCAKYGPDDPNDDSCTQQATAERELKQRFNVCVSQSDYYSFEPCS